MPHQPHEHTDSGAFGGQCCGETAATAVAAGSFDPSIRVESEEELGQRIRCETSFGTLLGVKQGCVGIFGRYRCNVGGNLLAQSGTDKHSAGMTPLGLIG